jgi:hypothetical protein
VEDQPIVVPEDLKGSSDEELTELRLQIQERVTSQAEAAAGDDTVLDEVEGLIGSYDRIDAELSERAEAAEGRALRVAAALERFAEPAAEADEAPAADEEVAAAATEAPEVVEAAVEAEPEAPAAEPVVEAAAEIAEEAATEAVAEAAVEPEVVTETVIEPAAVVEATVETPAAPVAEAPAVAAEPTELAAEEVAEATVAEATVTDTPQEGTTVEHNIESGSELAATRPDALSPVAVAPAGAELAARGMGMGISDGTKVDIDQVAASIFEKTISRTAVAPGVREYVPIATAIAAFSQDETLGSGPQENFSILRALADKAKGISEYNSLVASGASEDDALVASGGVCAPLAPDYNFFRLAEEMNPVERALPVAPAPRGGIRYITPPDFRDAAPGVRITTEAQDAAGYESQGGPTPDKPCVAVECPAIQECRVDAVSRCVTFGNLNYRVFPEQIAAFLADLSVIFTETKEIFYLDAIDAASTPVTAANAYGATRAVIHDLLVASANYRRRHHMSPTATLQLLLPSWLPELLKVDLVNDHSLGLNFIDADLAQVNSFFAKANLDVAWYYDSATGAGQAFNGVQAEGELNEFPGTVVSYLFSPGTFVRLDAGTLDVGLVRDSILNGTNDLQLFAEQWIQVCMVGIESLRIEHTLCPSGTAPEPVTPLECVGASS